MQYWRCTVGHWQRFPEDFWFRGKDQEEVQQQAFVIVWYACFDETNALEAIARKALLAVVVQTSLPQRVLHWQTLRNEHILPAFHPFGSHSAASPALADVSQKSLSLQLALQLVVPRRRMHGQRPYG
jgi:hypothetical protein